MKNERLTELSEKQVELIIPILNSELDVLYNKGEAGKEYYTQLKEARNILEWSLGAWIHKRKEQYA
tara:strand:- start:5 stop:202 length:198 start_codon:yes stop_codon:yes gene_type:complete